MFGFVSINEINMSESTLIVDLSEKTLLVRGLSRFQITFKRPHMHHKQLIHLGWVVM
jgi:hypothetical protein